MKIIKIPDFFIEIDDEIIKEYHKNLTNDELVEQIVDDVQSLGYRMCFNEYEVQDAKQN